MEGGTNSIDGCARDVLVLARRLDSRTLVGKRVRLVGNPKSVLQLFKLPINKTESNFPKDAPVTRLQPSRFVWVKPLSVEHRAVKTALVSYQPTRGIGINRTNDPV